MRFLRTLQNLGKDEILSNLNVDASKSMGSQHKNKDAPKMASLRREEKKRNIPLQTRRNQNKLLKAPMPKQTAMS